MKRAHTFARRRSLPRRLQRFASRHGLLIGSATFVLAITGLGVLAASDAVEFGGAAPTVAASDLAAARARAIARAKPASAPSGVPVADVSSGTSQSRVADRLSSCGSVCFAQLAR